MSKYLNAAQYMFGDPEGLSILEYKLAVCVNIIC